MYFLIGAFKIFPLFHNLAIFLFSEIVIFMISWWLVLKWIVLSLRGCPILLSLVRFQTELDSTQSYYHYLFLQRGC